MRHRRTEVYRVERERGKLPVIYDKVSFHLDGKELAAFEAGVITSRETPLCPDMLYEAICRVSYDISGLD